MRFLSRFRFRPFENLSRWQISTTLPSRRFNPYQAAAYALLAVILALAGVIFFYKTSARPSPDETHFLPEVEVVVLQSQSNVRSIKSPGSVTYLEKASVSSRIPGRLASLQAEQGSKVRKGQALAQLERLEMELQLRQTQASLKSAQAQYRLAQAQYGQARREVERRLKQIESSQAGMVEARAQFVNSRQNLLMKMELYRMGGISRKELRSLHSEYLSGMSRYYQSRKQNQSQMIGFRDADLARSGNPIPVEAKEKTESFIDFNTTVEKSSATVALENANRVRVEIRNMERLLAETFIRSPINGIVATRTIDIGEEVKAGEPLFTIVRMDELLVSTNVSENDLGRVHPGQHVRFRADALNGKEFTGTVRLISPVIDLNTRTGEVRIDVKNPDRLLTPGMFVRCFIDIESRKNILLLPEEAFTEINDERRTATIFIVQKDHVFRRQVQTGDLFDEGREVLAGVSEGERVATGNVALLKEGSRIRVADMHESNGGTP